MSREAEVDIPMSVEKGWAISFGVIGTICSLGSLAFSAEFPDTWPVTTGLAAVGGASFVAGAVNLIKDRNHSTTASSE